MKSRQIGPFRVAALGLGCMNLSHAYGQAPAVADAERLLLQAFDAGVTLFDTAALYGFGANETLVGRVLRTHRQQVVLCSKGGMTGQPVGPGGALQRVIDGRPKSLQRDCEASLRRLQTEVIDLYYLHRWDKSVPIEDSVGALSRLVEQGKVRSIGLSEVSATTLRRAHAVHPITALQTEFSLSTRNPQIAVLQACRELGVGFVAFSPLGRGLLTADPPVAEAMDEKDIRRGMPRFAAANYALNLRLQERLTALAQPLACTVAQLALGWLLHQVEDVLPIPGTTRAAHLTDNLGAAALVLSATTLEQLDALFAPEAIAGARYSAASQAEVDTEVWVA